MADREELALQVVDLAKASVLADNHFLSSAVGRLHVVPMQLATPFATDGYFLGFDPKHVLARFRRTGAAPKRNLLHSVAHCLFLHPYVSASVDQPLWNLACDIAAERMVADLLGALPGEKGARISLALQQIERDMGCRISAERVYRRLRDGWWADVAGEWMGLMHSDSHDLWYAPAQSGNDRQGEGTGEGTDPFGGVGSLDGIADSSLAKGSSEHEDNPERGNQGALEESPHAEDTSDDAGDSPSADAAPTDAHAPSAKSPASDKMHPPRQDGAQTDYRASQPTGQTADAGQPTNTLDDARLGFDAGSFSNQTANADRVPDAVSRNGRQTDDGDTGADGSACATTAHGLQAEGRKWGHEAGHSTSVVRTSAAHFGLEQTAQPSMQQQQAEWRQVATSLAVNLQTLSARQGGKLAGFVADLQESAQQRADYATFLRQFAHPGEVMRLSDEEFDNVFYTYGLELYGNVPLIEPLEYREERRVREFAIIIDTSASVQGDIVRAFVACTFDILKETEAFFDQVHIRILQCDAHVQTDDRIASVEELERWGRTMRIIGGGGTDFRPAFAYVNALVEQGAFRDLDGLVYFTDGFGTFPEYTPAYRTAFVFYDEDHRAKRVPPWAAQIVLDRDTMQDESSARSRRLAQRDERSA